jgi:hypothetical protein
MLRALRVLRARKAVPVHKELPVQQVLPEQMARMDSHRLSKQQSKPQEPIAQAVELNWNLV